MAGHATEEGVLVVSSTEGYRCVARIKTTRRHGVYSDIGRPRPCRQIAGQTDETVFMKLVVDRADDRVVGCHMIGTAAGELSQLLGVAIKAGATKAQFDETVAVHPTSAEEFVTMYTLTTA